MSRFALKNTSFSSRWTVTGVGTKRIVQKRSSLWKPSKSTPENNEASDSDASEMRMDEDMIAKLRKAEEESERLKREVATLRDAALAKAGRTFWNRAPIDSKDLKRETILQTNDKNGNWLSETDVEFLTGSGEKAVSGLSPEEQAIVNRRLAIGGAFAAFFAAFAFIPTESFNLFKPSGDATEYLVPVLRSRDLLTESFELIDNAEWQQVRTVIDRIVFSPNKLKSNMESALAFLSTSKERTKARRLTFDAMEYVQEMDYNKYFEDRLNPQRFRGGAEEARFVEFSSNAAKTARDRIDTFLSLFSSEAVATARKRIPPTDR